ncbi:MAG: hypothetical protein U1F71_18110 [Verrucomicrobiaceae bacterium]
MKASERRLIAILGVLAAVCGGAIMTQMLLRRQGALDRRAETLELQQREATAMLAEAGLWNARLAWLKAHQPAMSSENQASQSLLDELLASASENHLTVQKKQLHEAVHEVYYHEVGVTLTVLGELPDVFRWLHGQLSPESFRLVSQLKITPDTQDKSKVVATVRVNRRHAPVVTATEAPQTGKEAGS